MEMQQMLVVKANEAIAALWLNQLKTISNIDTNFEMFLKIYDVYKLENPDAKPHTETLPTTVKLNN